MPGGWFCCCGVKDCTIWCDNFDGAGTVDYPAPTTDLGPNWTEQSGDWGLAISTEPKYSWDGALFEISGTGDVWSASRWFEADGGFQVSFYTIDEIPYQRYKILLNLDKDTGVCTVCEWYTGSQQFNLPVDEWSDPATLSIYSSTTGPGSGVSIQYGSAPSTVQGGNVFYARYVKDGGLTCIGLTDYINGDATDFWPLLTTMGSGASGYYAGVANASGSQIPIQIDDFCTYRLFTDSQHSQMCFGCTCHCTYEDEEQVIRRVLYPAEITLEIEVWCIPWDIYNPPVGCSGGVQGGAPDGPPDKGQTAVLRWDEDLYPNNPNWRSDELPCSLVEVGVPLSFRAALTCTGSATFSGNLDLSWWIWPTGGNENEPMYWWSDSVPGPIQSNCGGHPQFRTRTECFPFCQEWLLDPTCSPIGGCGTELSCLDEPTRTYIRMRIGECDPV